MNPDVGFFDDLKNVDNIIFESDFAFGPGAFLDVEELLFCSIVVSHVPIALQKLLLGL